MKPIYLSGHARDNGYYRGATEEEIVEAIRNAKWETAEHARLQCRYDFVFKEEWNGKYYSTKQVRPIFVEEPEGIAVITVYTYYF